MTISKKRVNISTVKAHLTRYLRLVRKGETITILDRDTPIAQILPFLNSGLPLLRIFKATKGIHELDKVCISPKLNTFDYMQLLREDRDAR